MKRMILATMLATVLAIPSASAREPHWKHDGCPNCGPLGWASPTAPPAGYAPYWGRPGHSSGGWGYRGRHHHHRHHHHHHHHHHRHHRR